MMTIPDLERLPEEIKREILQYAEYLAERSHIVPSKHDKRWADVSDRGASIGENAGETVVRMREEERC